MQFVRKVSLVALVIASTVAWATTASADIIVLSIVDNSNTDNVLLTPATNQNIVSGTIGNTTDVVFFESDTNNLNANPSGQATVTPAGNVATFNEISFYMEGETFTRAVFNLNSATTGVARISVTGINIDGGLFTQNLDVTANGQNFWSVYAINGQRISQISLLGLNGVIFEDLRQVRVGVGDITDTDVPQVPEPASMLLFGTGLAGLAAARRRRNAAK